MKMYYVSLDKKRWIRKNWIKIQNNECGYKIQWFLFNLQHLIATRQTDLSDIFNIAVTFLLNESKAKDYYVI